MTSRSQPGTVPTEPPPPLDTAKYEDTFGVEEDDATLVAALAQTVGNHLYTVDHQYVGSNSNNKALQLDNEKIFKDVPGQPNPVQSISPPHAASTSPKITHRPRSAPPPIPSVTVDSDILRRLEKLESGLSTIRKARRIKRGISYTVSSNSMKGVIKDAELLADYVISEVAKGVNTITIKRDDSKHSE